MTTDRTIIARQAVRAAFEMRRTLGVARASPVNVFDVAAALGIEVRFLDTPSMEGMFFKAPHPAILLPSSAHRPRGRIAFTCAHEIGHHQLGHGTRIDDYIDYAPGSHQSDPEEFAANSFASTLLMPRTAVLARFAAREIRPEDANPLDLFIIASELGVGYETLAKHLRWGLEMVGHRWLSHRIRVSPKQIREQICGNDGTGALTVIEPSWPNLPIDLEDGDVVAVGSGVTIKGACLTDVLTRHPWRLYRVHGPGVCDVCIDGVPRSMRIARRGYCGRLRFRYCFDPEEA